MIHKLHMIFLNPKKRVQGFVVPILLILLPLHSFAQDTIGICHGEDILLNVGSTYTGDLQWQSANNISSFTDVPGATANLYSITVVESKYYRAQLTSGTCDPVYSDIIYIEESSKDVFSQSTTSEFSNDMFDSTTTGNDKVTLEVIPVLNLGTGSEGGFSTSGNTTLTGGVHNFTTFTIATGDTVYVTGSTPLQLFATSGVNINGILYLAGRNGQTGVNNGPPGAGGAGGGGGGYAGGGGGDGGLTTGPTYHGQNGGGPGGGEGGQTVATWYGGGGGSYGTMGTNGQNATTGNGSAGPIYGNAMLSTLQGGSGGGGGAADDDAAGVSTSDDGGGGGGGGGGAVRVTTDTMVIGSSGIITANGGGGGSCGNGGGGAGGSGGAIHLNAYDITNNGLITALGGTGSGSTYGGNGGDGRVRLDYLNLSNNGSMTPAVGYTGTAGSYSTTGTIESTPISFSPSELCGWGELEFDVDTSLTGTGIFFDILDNLNNVIAPHVTHGMDLSTIPSVSSLTEIKLRATLTTTVSSNTPVLNSWKVYYYKK